MVVDNGLRKLSFALSFIILNKDKHKNKIKIQLVYKMKKMVLSYRWRPSCCCNVSSGCCNVPIRIINDDDDNYMHELSYLAGVFFKLKSKYRIKT